MSAGFDLLESPNLDFTTKVEGTRPAERCIGKEVTEPIVSSDPSIIPIESNGSKKSHFLSTSKARVYRINKGDPETVFDTHAELRWVDGKAEGTRWYDGKVVSSAGKSHRM